METLVPLINGKVIEDGGGAATSWLTGTYRGQPEDAALRDRLLASGVIDEIARFGPEEIRFQARAKTLMYSEDVTPLWVPALERFQEKLEFLLRLARVNEGVNPA